MSVRARPTEYVSDQITIEIKYLDVGPQAQLPPPYAEDISALLTMALIDRAL